MLWRLRAYPMNMRRRVLPFPLIAVALLCLLPAALQARVRPHRPVVTKPSPRRDHNSPKLRKQKPSSSRHAGHAALQAPAAPRHRGSAAKQKAKARLDPHTAIAGRKKTAPHAASPSATARNLFERRQNEPASAAQPAAPVPVVELIRHDGERPELPSIADAAAMPQILPSLYNKRGRLIVPPALKGSHEILLHQNEVATQDGLERVQDDAALDEMRRRIMLVALPTGGGMQVDERLPVNRRFCRPWTAQFLSALARAHSMQFHTPLQVNSAVRTVEFQQKLIHTNGNAAPANGETASPHLTGQAVDIAKRGLSLSEIAWMRGYLLPLVQEGKIDVEEEFQQACFHISVYKKYLPPGPMPMRSIATSHRDPPAALAIAIH